MLGLLRKVVPRVVRRSYALKFAIALFVLGLAVGAIGIVGTMQIHDGVQSNVYEDHGTLALQQSEAVSEFHGENQRTVETVARNSELAEDQETIQEFVETEVSNRGGGGLGELHLHVLEADDGSVIASSMVGPGGELQGGWLEELDERSGTYVTDGYRSGGVDGSEPRVGYVTDGGNLPDGTVLVYTVSLHDYTVSSSDSTHTMVVDGSGTVAFDEHRSATLESYDEDDSPIVDAAGLSSSEAGGMEAGPASGILAADELFAGEQYVVGYSPVPGSDWVALVHTPTEQAYGFVEDVQFYGALATLGAVVLIGFVGAGIGWNTSRSIDRLTRKASRMEEGDLEVDLESPRIDSIGRLYDGFDSMRVSLQDQIEAATDAREEAERAQAETEEINRHLEAKADEYSEVMQACATGDLTVRMDAESENEAMIEIATEFNDMLAELEATTAAVKSFATDVATASEQVTASSEEVRSASAQVSESIQEISAGADRQNEQIQAVTSEMNALSTTTEEIAASSDEVADIAERTARAGERGREAAQDALEGMNEVEAESEAAVEEIEQLQSEVEQIDDLLEFITEIAEQTNMLALNANIEASRSGESSDGFAAVAGEVKELAEETKDAAGDIERRLERIQAQTDRTAEVVQLTSERVSEHTESVDDATEALGEIAEYAAETNTGVQEIAAASDQQATSVQEVVVMADDVASIAAETSAESETVAAAAEEQTTALTEVSQSAGTLTNQAAQLSESLDHFETDPDDHLADDEPAEDLVLEGSETTWDDADTGDGESTAVSQQRDEAATSEGATGETAASDDATGAASDGETFRFEHEDDGE